jgi:PPOX class probable F420-dependent enzyme
VKEDEMLPPMSNQDAIQAFLNRTKPALLGVVGTVEADGSPHIVPVWYRYDGTAITIWTLAGRRWVRNAERDPRAAFSVQEDRAPFVAVVMKGQAEVVTGDDAWISAEIRHITRRYVDQESEVEPYIQRWAHLRTIVTIKPEKISAWRTGY